jgi:flagellar motor switch protein FliM
MTRTLDRAEAQPVSLMRERDDAPGFPGLDRIGDRLARGLGGLIAGGAARAPTTLKTFGAWRAEQGDFAALCRYQLSPIKGTMLLAMPPSLIVQMVDLFYGGAGEVSGERREFTTAEMRFISRFGEHCLPLFANAWADVAPLDPALIGIETDVAATKLGKDNDLVVVQPFAVQIAGTPLTLSCVYPVAALRPIVALSDAPQPETATAVDPVWRDRLTDAVLEVRLPMRSIFARPELPLGRLLTLKAGDVIPICLPSYIPITVAGRLFAHGTVGEANGRAAIRIEKIEQGSLTYE